MTHIVRGPGTNMHISVFNIKTPSRAIKAGEVHNKMKNNQNAFQSKAHLPLTDRKSNTYNLTLV